MTTQSTTLSEDIKKDLERNRNGRLSTRQWIELITEPLTTLLLLSVPLILISGRYGPAGRLFVLAIVLGFVVMIVMRAIRFSRVKLHYRILYVEHLYPRWQVWRNTKLMTKSGKPIQFNHQLSHKQPLQKDQALMVYYIEVGDRRVLVSCLPQKHPKASSAIPASLFANYNGIHHKD
jgi:hypothetical protein